MGYGCDSHQKNVQLTARLCYPVTLVNPVWSQNPHDKDLEGQGHIWSLLSLMKKMGCSSTAAKN